MTELDRLLPDPDWSERYERPLPCAPEEAVAAFLAAPVAPDPLVRTLLRLRGLGSAPTVEQGLQRMRFEVLHRSPTEVVVGASGTPWRPRGGIRPFAAADAGTVRFATDVRAIPTPAGCVLSTETRIAANDADARRAFRRYWFVVRPFSGLIRRRWLVAAARACS